MDQLISEYKKREYLSVVALFVLVISIGFAMRPPRDFPTKTIVSVPEGIGLYQLTEEFKDKHVIRSSFWFRTTAILLGGEHGMQAGDYYMSAPQSPFYLAWRVARGKYDLERVRITIPEGFTVKQISALLDNRFQFFNHQYFELAAPEGYLFPDTYFIQVSATATSTIRLLKDNFIRRIFSLMPEVEDSKRSLEEIVTMASILEGEATSSKDRAIVAGILWKRYDLGMPLQVDATFKYINGKTTKELTADDLKINSPYNTYLYKGLPPTPISNPGLDAMEAAIHPATSTYLYFLTADDGTMHYAKTFEEHIANKQKYLK